MECFSTAYMFLHGVTDTCSFLDVPFYTAKVLLGDFMLLISIGSKLICGVQSNNFCSVYYGWSKGEFLPCKGLVLSINEGSKPLNSKKCRINEHQ